MKNRDKWQPSKYVYKKGKLIASRDRKEVGVGSRLIADLIAQFYDKTLRKYAKGKLLDLGCGKVPLFIAYKAYITDNICVDWEKGSHKNEYVDFECDLTKVLSFKDEEFDTIILSDVLEHIPQPEYLWKEMYRMLSINGMIIMNVPFFYYLHEQPYDYYRYTKFALQRFVENSGLNLVQLTPIGGTPEILADIFAKHIQFFPLIGKSLAIVIQYITELFVKTTLGKKLSEKTAQAFPLGYFLIAEKVK
jgi:SAM-dependent methyltransferase